MAILRGRRHLDGRERPDRLHAGSWIAVRQQLGAWDGVRCPTLAITDADAHPECSRR
jgi:hypothetical protein